jgi:signal transduction histidine kinase
VSNEDNRAQSAPTNPAQLQATLNVIPAYTWYAASSGGLTFVNKRTADYLGLPKDHPLRFGIDTGAQWDAHIPLLHPDDHKETREVWSACLRTGEAGEASFRVRDAQGGYRWFLSRAEPVRANDGTVLQWVGVNLDIEELKSAEQALRSTQARLGRASQLATVAELSASIAHEINQPLSAVISNAQTCQTWLSGSNPNVARARAAVDRIVRDAAAAAEVVRRIRALYRKTPPDKSQLQINEVIEEVWQLLRNEMIRRAILADLDLGQLLPPTAADRIQVQQVLLNLMRNGIEAMEGQDDPKRLVVRSRYVDARIIVEVCDSGPGLADKEKIFELLYSTKQNGMGVGLAISRSIIQAHEGELWARDNTPRGAIFTFTLPMP